MKRTAGRLDLTEAYVRTLLNSGKLKGRKRGSGAGGRGKWFVSRASILEFESGA